MNAKYCCPVCRAPAPPGPRKWSILGPARPRGAWFNPSPHHHHPGRPGAAGLRDPPSSKAATPGFPRQLNWNRWWERCLYVDIKQPQCLAFICAVVLAGNPRPPFIRHVRSTSKQRGLVNSLLQLGELNAITRVFVTDLQIPASHLPSGWMLQSEESGHAFPSNYLLTAIILRILWFSFILSRENKAAVAIKRHIN